MKFKPVFNEYTLVKKLKKEVRVQSRSTNTVGPLQRVHEESSPAAAFSPSQAK
jgi:hypothetical protein